MLNILIVEDDVAIRELLSYNLKKKFKIFHIEHSETFAESLRELTQNASKARTICRSECISHTLLHTHTDT